MQTVRQALNEKRRELSENIKALVLCKGELFYVLKSGETLKDTVYPVTRTVAQNEALALGVEFSEQ